MRVFVIECVRLSARRVGDKFFFLQSVTLTINVTNTPTPPPPPPPAPSIRTPLFLLELLFKEKLRVTSNVTDLIVLPSLLLAETEEFLDDGDQEPFLVLLVHRAWRQVKIHAYALKSS